jgi:Ca2+-binding RTX toxin-like protein
VLKRSTAWAVIGSVVAFLGTAVQAAYAANVSVTVDSISYVAATGEANQLTIDGAARKFTDPGAVITAGAGCHSVSAHVVTCDDPFYYPGYTFAVDLGDGNDTATFTNAVSSQESDAESFIYHLLFELQPGPLGPGSSHPDIDGGAGNDVLQIGDESLDAAVLRGGPGNDRLIGNTESDVLIPGTGADVVTGGDGDDGVSYGDRTGNVSVSFDGVANDGEAGEGDNVGTDVEEVGTGSGNDIVTGSASANSIYTHDGNDRVYAGGGRDLVVGGTGNDTIYGGDGNDDIYDGPGDDFVAAGAGDDFIEPEGGLDPVDQGADQYYGGAGQDRLVYGGGLRSPGVQVTFDDRANDGVPGEGDNVHDDVEIVEGTPHDDVLIGDEGANWLIGGGGHDRLIGGKGIDILSDAGGRDYGASPSYIDGGVGTDIVDSWSASDTVICGQGIDILASETLHPADCEIVDPTREVVHGIESACGSPVRCAATINAVLKRG